MKELPEIGEYLVDHTDSKIVTFITRCLGFTAVAIEALLDEINDDELSNERWGIDDVA